MGSRARQRKAYGASPRAETWRRICAPPWGGPYYSAAQEAVALDRALAKENPQAFTPDLARTLSSFGDVLVAGGRVNDSLAAYTECAQLLRPFVDAMPDAYGGLFQANLRDLLKALQASGKKEAEIVAALDALGVKLDGQE